jgi:hypothetical protein
VTNRKTILLAVLVMGIWGTIGFKIYRQITDDGLAARATPVRHVRDTITQQRLHLSLTYNDPFLKTPSKKPVAAPVKKVLPRAVAVTPPVVVVDWARIKYLGTVTNGSRKKLLATLRLGNTDYLLREGEPFEGFSLLKITRDSVKVGYEKSMKYIKRE